LPKKPNPYAVRAPPITKLTIAVPMPSLNKVKPVTINNKPTKIAQNLFFLVSPVDWVFVLLQLGQVTPTKTAGVATGEADCE